MDEREKTGFDYEAHERLKKELEEAGAKGLEDAETSDATLDDEFEAPVAGGPLPPFWKPEEVGARLLGEIVAVRKTKEFEEGRAGEALDVRGAQGMSSVPVSIALSRVEWRRYVGRVVLFIFKGWIELEGGTRMRDIEARPKKEIF
jgi:hypothetical protein